MPAENLTMYEKSSGTGKKIEYRVQKVSGTGYDVYATFNASRGVSLTVEDQMPITGFTYDSWKKAATLHCGCIIPATAIISYLRIALAFRMLR